MLKACVLDQPTSWDQYMPLVEFAYNNSYHVSIGMAPYEALYRRKCQSPLCWYEAREKSLIEPEMLHKYTIDPSHVLEPESIQVREDLTLPVTPVRIDDTNIKRLRGKEVSLVKVAWSRAGIEEHTWELESEMRKDYPHLFSDATNWK
ncbi:uncharacterized protein [Arachis hypogaea]|uniref:uncharacterized protein n=1 Tax=Arachis hypogaea TaxID=3818 RepID=UPI003B2236F1